MLEKKQLQIEAVMALLQTGIMYYIINTGRYAYELTQMIDVVQIPVRPFSAVNVVRFIFPGKLTAVTILSHLSQLPSAAALASPATMLSSDNHEHCLRSSPPPFLHYDYRPQRPVPLHPLPHPLTHSPSPA